MLPGGFKSTPASPKGVRLDVDEKDEVDGLSKLSEGTKSQFLPSSSMRPKSGGALVAQHRSDSRETSGSDESSRQNHRRGSGSDALDQSSYSPVSPVGNGRPDLMITCGEELYGGGMSTPQGGGMGEGPVGFGNISEDQWQQQQHMQQTSVEHQQPHMQLPQVDSPFGMAHCMWPPPAVPPPSEPWVALPISLVPPQMQQYGLLLSPTQFATIMSFQAVAAAQEHHHRQSISGGSMLGGPPMPPMMPTAEPPSMPPPQPEANIPQMIHTPAPPMDNTGSQRRSSGSQHSVQMSVDSWGQPRCVPPAPTRMCTRPMTHNEMARANTWMTNLGLGDSASIAVMPEGCMGRVGGRNSQSSIGGLESLRSQPSRPPDANQQYQFQSESTFSGPGSGPAQSPYQHQDMRVQMVAQGDYLPPVPSVPKNRRGSQESGGLPACEEEVKEDSSLERQGRSERKQRLRRTSSEGHKRMNTGEPRERGEPNSKGMGDREGGNKERTQHYHQQQQEYPECEWRMRDASQTPTGGDHYNMPRLEQPPPRRTQGFRIFVSRLGYETGVTTFRDYFGKFGHILDAYIPKKPQTNQNKGFGFITFSDKESVDRVMGVSRHVVDCRPVVVDRADAEERTWKPPPPNSPAGKRAARQAAKARRQQ